MHEASIALGILDIAREHCKKAGYHTIQSIEVNIGAASGVLPEALALAFDIAKTDSIAQNASLIIHRVPLGGSCGSLSSGSSGGGFSNSSGSGGTFAHVSYSGYDHSRVVIYAAVVRAIAVEFVWDSHT